MRRLLPLITTAILLVGVCSSDDGGSAGEGAESTSSTLAGEVIEISSPAFGEGEMIPGDFAGCVDGARGPNESPPLEWSGIPDDAVELAVTVVDPDADGFVHWAVGGVDPEVSGFDQGEVPSGAVEAFNDTGSGGWFGPCPPESHTYVFRVHALRTPSGVEVGMTPSDALAAIESATELTAEFTATFDPDA